MYTNDPELIADLREHVLYMQELGVDAIDVPLREEAVSAKTTKAVSPPPPAMTVRSLPPEDLRLPKKDVEVRAPATGGSRLSKLPSLKERATTKRAAAGSSDAGLPVPAAPVFIEPASEPAADAVVIHSDDTIQSIRAEIGDCTRCPLAAGRTQVVHTTGNFDADLMFVGEAPGADEDVQGFPFVGRAGQLLTRIIEGMGYSRDQVAIGNINRCRPPGNRQPTLPEAHTCRPFLLREIAVIKPKVIVVMGNTALHNLLDTKVGITKMRGDFQDYFGVKVMPTFHPAYLLRDPHKKREVWEDMKKVRDYLVAK